MKKIGFCIIALTMLTGCITNSYTYENVNESIRKVYSLKDGEKILTGYEMMDEDTAMWFDAEEKDGVWKLTHSGKAKRKALTGKC